MPSSPRILVAVATAAATLAFAAPASAATVVTSPCIGVASGTTNTLPVAGGGFTPGATVTLRYASSIAPTPSFLATAIVDAAGNFAPSPTPPLFNKFDTQEQTSRSARPTASTPASSRRRPSARSASATARPRRPAADALARHTVRGLPPARTSTCTSASAARRSATCSSARTSPCGIVSKRMRLLPTRSRPGRWTVYVDQSKTYQKATRPQLKYAFTITRTFLD